jgi:adenosylcobinamide kinase/adenosylcobinamide-phosphate guanylyltransferase
MLLPLSCATLLVLGGARSGKSAYAQAVVERSGLERVFLATAEAGDAEMAERIGRHRADRYDTWRTVEEPLDLPGVLAREAQLGRAVLADCLTLWLSNVMLAGRDPDRETKRLVAALRACPGPTVLVSNEVGFGLVPDTPLGRTFRDAQGQLNAAVAGACEAVVMLVAGCPLPLKPATGVDVLLTERGRIA